MKTSINAMFKNEEKLLSQILKIWQKYPIDYFVFYNDRSTDNSVNVIKSILPEHQYTIINCEIETFNESLARQKMLDVSRELNVDIMFSLDCDELFTSNIIKNWEKFLNHYKTTNVELFWYNCVNNSLNLYRCDPLYVSNYKSFVAPLKKTNNWNITEHKHHQPRLPYIDLPKAFTNQCGVLHLQALNRRYYAIKQLWYKHFEFVTYKHSIEFINNRYDLVVNNLQFNEKKINHKLIEYIEFDISIFDTLEKEKGYLDFVKTHYNPDLVTFGQEFLN